MKIIATALALLLVCSVAQANIHWTWTNAITGTEIGTFDTDGDLVGADALPGSYTILDFSVTASLYGAPIGSVSGGEYYIGMPDIGFEWNGSAPTEFWRQNGGYTNGFGLWVSEGSAPNVPDYIAFSVDWFVVENYEYEVIFLEEYATAIITPHVTAAETVSMGDVKVLY
jgi:hypothetical protein